MKILSSSSPNPHVLTSSWVYNSNTTFEALSIKAQCEILKHLEQSDLLQFRLISRKINELIESHFIFNVTISDVNLERNWKLNVPWGKYNQVDQEMMYSSPKKIKIGELKHSFSRSLDFVARTIQELEFTQATSIRNIRNILKQCWASHVLRLHSSIFIGGQNTICSKTKKYSKIELNMNRLSRLYIILDNFTMNEETPCTVQYWLKINLQPRAAEETSSRLDFGQIQFLAEGLENDPIEIFKTWIVDDEIIDIFSRPDILRKITYFAAVNEAELREISVKFVPQISIPSCIYYANSINHPGFYPQLKKYNIGPFNGAMLTYFSTNRKQILTYRPINLQPDALVMNFSDAAQLVLTERDS